MLQDGAYRYEDRCVKYLNVLEGATSTGDTVSGRFKSIISS